MKNNAKNILISIITALIASLSLLISKDTLSWKDILLSVHLKWWMQLLIGMQIW
jgi:hypothetical protein